MLASKGCAVPDLPPMVSTGFAAAGGMLLGRIAASIPLLNKLRTENPMLYDATMGAALVAALKLIQAEKQQDEQEEHNHLQHDPAYSRLV